MGSDEKIIKVHISTFFKHTDVPIRKMAEELKELFVGIFPQTPEIISLPGAPAEVTRCRFQNQNHTANLSFSLIRMDFECSFKEGAPWKNYADSIAYMFTRLCINLGVGVKLLAITVQTPIEESTKRQLNKQVSLVEFKDSDEKTLSWVRHDQEENDLKINIITTLQEKHCIPGVNGFITIEANTHDESKLPQDIQELSKIIAILISKIEEKLHDPFYQRRNKEYYKY